MLTTTFPPAANQLAGPLHEAQVAGVQIPHRRHKADAHPCPLPASGKTLHGRHRPYDSHRAKSGGSAGEVSIL